MRHIDVNDSDSDDEPPPVFTFSKVTEALLNDGPMPPSSPARQEHNSSAQRFVRSASAPKNLDTPSRAPAFKIIRNSSPSTFGKSDSQDGGKTPPRIVQLGSAQKGSERRTIAIGGPYPQRFAIKREPTPQAESRNEIVTPAPAPRASRMSRTRAGSNASQDGHMHEGPSSSRPGSRSGSRGGYKSSSEQVETSHFASSVNRHASLQQAPDTASRYAPSTVSRSRNPSADTAPPPGSTRIKRAPIGTGTFLRSGPVRRGFKRRESEENISPADDYQSGSGSASKYASQEDSARSEAVRSRNDSVNIRAPSAEPVSVHDYAHEKHVQSGSRPSSRQASIQFSRSQSNHDGPPLSRQTSREFSRSRQPSVERYQPVRQASAQPSDVSMTEVRSRRPSNEQSQTRPTQEQALPQRAPSNRQAHRPMPARVHLEDQENVPPPTFKRNKDQEFKYLGRQNGSVMSDDEKPKPRMAEQTPVPVPAQQQDRKALGAMSGNTPHRPAPPPPPKMSVLETATATAGASTTKSRKKRSHMVVKGKIFTQMGRLGKGGSSDVYCVMAENYKTFALKRVKLDDCDENAVKGYKGEIDLLKQLTDVERVVRLYDWELLEEKQELLVLMEKGETDLNRLLTLRINGVDAKFDSAFVRYHWQEMLDCVASVHEQEIVHSDLKPANFLLVQGRLKLIDFGIANAIDTDNTCNVHRESHVGTPNYMSPESITDTNGSSGNGRDAEGRPLKKDMRIGKASDVWSMGCILYQMTYGRPPFAHIPNQISRIMAITNPKVAIEYPERGIGGTVVPASLKGTLRRCLQRDPELRPTAKQLLSESDGFLNPETGGAVMMSEDLLRQIIDKVVDRCRDPKKGVPTPEEVRTYPGSFMVKIREMVEKG
jgi:serine/threonine-protein kinase TTK/MPS1